MKPPSKDRILLVEDNPDDELLTRSALEKAGRELEIQVLRDGEEAIHFLETQERLRSGSLTGKETLFEPRLAIVDIKLPKIDGIHFLRELREKKIWPCLPVVILSTSDEANHVEEAYRRGANGYLCKPVDFHNFSRKMKTVVDFWLEHNLYYPEEA